MKKFSTLLLTGIIVLNAMAQTDSAATRTILPDSSQPRKPYQAWVKTTDGRVINGWLYQTSDNGIILLQGGKREMTGWPHINFNPAHSLVVNTDQIQSIGLRKKNSAAKGALLGLTIGVATGVIIGLASGDDPVQPYTGTFTDLFVGIGNAFAMTAGEKALAGGVLLGGTGAIVGVIIGALAKKKFIIGGKKQKVRDLQAALAKRLVTQE